MTVNVTNTGNETHCSMVLTCLVNTSVGFMVTVGSSDQSLPCADDPVFFQLSESQSVEYTVVLIGDQSEFGVEIMGTFTRKGMKFYYCHLKRLPWLAQDTNRSM